MAEPGTPAALSDRRWVILSVVAAARLMVVLDATIVNIALPSAQRALGFPDSDRQWVVTAYALAFGSLVLVGGRLAHQHQSRHESVRAHVRSGTTRAYPASDDADFLTGTAFPVHGGTTAAFTVPDRPKRMVETRPLVTTKSNRYVTFSARAINHPAGPGRVR